MHHIPAPTNIRIEPHHQSAPSRPYPMITKDISESQRSERRRQEKPLLLLALVPLAVGLVLIYVVIGSKNREENAKRTLLCVFSALMVVAGRVGHRETTRMTLHAAACCPAYCPCPFPALRAIPAITSLPRSQAHETLEAMTTIIMCTSHDNP